MPDTAPVPNIVPIPGVDMGPALAAGSGGSGGDDNDANKGNEKDKANGGNGGEDAGDDNRSAEGDPVNAVTGAVFTLPITDLGLSGPLSFTFVRTFRTGAITEDCGLGLGWSHSLGWRVEVRQDRIRVWNHRGVWTTFPLSQIGDSVVGQYGWALRRDSDGFTLDAGDDTWRSFAATFDEGNTYRLTSIEDRNRNRIAVSYDDRGRIAAVLDSAGRTIKFTSSDRGHITSISVKDAEPNGRWIAFGRYEYDEESRLVRVTDADDHSWTYAYDEFNRLVRQTNRIGFSVHYRYDTHDRCIESWGEYPGQDCPGLTKDVSTFLADGKTRAKGIYHRRFDYHADRFNEVTDSTETRRYFGTPKGALGKLVTGGGVTSSEYDERGFEIARTEADGASTRWVRDERGRVTERIDPLGRRTRIARDPYGLPTRVVDPQGGVLRADRDSRGNLERLVEPDGTATQWRTDERGLLTDITLANGGVEHRSFDIFGNRVEIVQVDGGRWEMKYDGLGRCLSIREPSGAETRNVYSDRGDLVAVHDANGGVTRFSYDGEQHLAETVTPAGRRTQLFWGGFNWLCARRDANGHLSRLLYSRDGDLIGVMNERDEVHRLVYDRAGKLIEEETFDGRRLRYRNDPTGRVIRAENGAGEITTFKYDVAGQLVEIGLPDDTTATFKYDLRGDFVEAVCKTGTFRFERDAGGRVVRETQNVGGVEHWVDVTYDAAGRRLGRRTSLGFAERVERDAMGARVRTVLDGAEVARHTNDFRSKETLRTLPGGGTIESKFGLMGHLVERVSRASTAGPMVGVDEPEWMGRRDDGTTSRTAYRYDADGMLVSAADSLLGVTAYEHDPLARLVSAIPEKARAELFRYDPTGNPYEAGAGDPDRVYGRGNRLLRRGSTEYVWDDDGRLVEKRETGPDGVRRWTYTWSGILLETVESPDGRRVEFGYDPFARRMTKRVLAFRDGQWKAETSTRFVWDADWLIHEIEGGAERATYLFADDSLAPSMQRTGADWLHFINDPAGAPKRLVDRTGQVAGEVDASVWGAGGPSLTPLRFQGQYADRETGLHYNRYRYYDPETALFVAPDPVGPAAGLNQYRYAPTPFSFIDPLGLFGAGSNATMTPPDSQGRMTGMTATIRPQDLGTGSGTNASSRAAARSKGHSNDDAGHVIGNRLGGSGGVGSVFPQDPHVNRGAFRDHEAWVAGQVAAGNKVDVAIQLNYTGNSTRPSSVTYGTTVNGVNHTPPPFPN